MTDLSKILQAAKTTVISVMKSDYVLSSTFVNRTPGLAIDLNGSTLTCPINQTAFIDQAGALTLRNFRVMRAATFLESERHGATIDNCEIGIAVPGSVVAAVLARQTGTGTQVLNSKIGLTTKVPLYFSAGGGTLVRNCTVLGSWHGAEYAIRCDIGDDGVTVPDGITVDGCTISNPPSAKDTIGIRVAKNFVLTNSSVHGNFRFGQKPKENGRTTRTTSDYVTARIAGVKIYGIGTGRSLLSLMEGSSVVANGIVFVNPGPPPISVDQLSSLVTSGLSMQVQYGQNAPKFASVATGSRWTDGDGGKSPLSRFAETPP
jgi:hypothetical protein